MLAAFFVASILVFAWQASRRLWAWGGVSPGPFEGAASTALLAFAAATGLNWALALAHVFTGWALVLGAAALLAVTLPALAKARRQLTAQILPTREGVVVALACAPLALWALYTTVRGAVVFPYASDALAYHLPKAVDIVRAHAFAMFDGPDLRVGTFPADYELLLADVLALERSDALTATISVAGFLFFAVAVAAAAERWWGRGGPHAVVAALVASAMPTVLIGCGAHKNDVLLHAVVIATLVSGARWAVTGERVALAWTMLGATLAVGTKPTGGVLALALVLAVAVRVSRAARAKERWPAAKELAAWAAAGAGAFFLLGGAAYVANVVTYGAPVVKTAGAGYGEWANLWRFPYLAFARPFSSSSAVWVPWRHEFWFWPVWDLFFGSYGLPATLALCAAPWAAYRYRRAGRPAERHAALAMATLCWFAILPLKVPSPPVGLFAGHVRYTAFFPAILIVGSVAPFVQELAESARRRALALGAVALAGALAASAAVRAALEDSYVPFAFVQGALLNPSQPPRAIHSWTVRAASWVDLNAAPDDKIAFDEGFDTWVYPAYGAELSRPVVFLHPAPPGQAVAIPDDVRWVAIDCSWHCFFGDPRFVDLSLRNLRAYALRGGPLPEELVLFHQLQADPRFELAYRDERSNQAVFRRR